MAAAPPSTPQRNPGTKNPEANTPLKGGPAEFFIIRIVYPQEIKAEYGINRPLRKRGSIVCTDPTTGANIRKTVYYSNTIRILVVKKTFPNKIDEYCVVHTKNEDTWEKTNLYTNHPIPFELEDEDKITFNRQLKILEILWSGPRSARRLNLDGDSGSGGGGGSKSLRF